MTTTQMCIHNLVILLLSTSAVAINLFTPMNTLHTENTVVTINGRSKRDVTSHNMAEYYDITWNVKGRETKARLYMTDLVADLRTYTDSGHVVQTTEKSLYRRDWATYDSEDIDGVFLLHRNQPNSSRLYLEGIFLHDRTPMLIQPINSSNAHVVHTIGQPLTQSAMEKEAGNYINLRHCVGKVDFGHTAFEFSLSKGTRTKVRRKRVNPGDMTAEVKVYTDSALRDILSRRMPEHQIDDFLTKYYAMMINFINSRFASLRSQKIRIYAVGAGLVMRKFPFRSMKKVKHHRSIDGIRQTSCEVATIQAFEQHVMTNLHDYDHATLLTGYDMLDKWGDGTTAGVANGDSICKRNAVSVVEFGFGVETMQVAAHELAHSLGAFHDGEMSRKCSPSQNYIMKASNPDPFSAPRGNWWLYSPCTAEEIKMHTTQTRLRGTLCLHKIDRYRNLNQIVPRDMLYGAAFPPTKQCKLLTGYPGSTFKKPSPLSDYHKICSEGISCLIPRKDTPSIVRYLPFPGTWCGPSKLCVDNKCLVDKSSNPVT